jgi:tetratricopeptide (TPR) repeat protein
MQLNLLAKSLRMDERYEEARELYERSLAVRERVLGKWHPNVATSLNNLGAMLTGIGQYEDVEPMLKRALAIDKKVYGAEHPRVATDLNNLAVLYNAQGRTGEAEKLCGQVCQILPLPISATDLISKATWFGIQ